MTMQQEKTVAPVVPKVPAYEPDDGPLTDEQIALIRKHSSATGIPDSAFTRRLFDWSDTTGSNKT